MRGRLFFPWHRFLQSTSALLLISGLAALPLAAQQYPQDNSGAGAAQNADNGAYPAPANQPGMQVPRTFTLPAGTLITVRTSQDLSSDQNHPGDSFSAELTQPLVVGGWVVARRGQTVLGRIETAQKAGRVKGLSKLALDLTRLVLVDGQQFSVRTQLVEGSGGTSHGRDVAAVGSTTSLGAIIGAAAQGGGEGAGIGAAIGAGAGIVGVLLTRGRPTVIPAETLMTFQLQQPLTFSTVGSEQAYHPVTQADYSSPEPRLQRRVDHIATPRPHYYPAYPPWGYYAYPPAFFVGYYGFGRFGCGRCGYRVFRGFRGYRGYGRRGFGGRGHGRGRRH